MSFKFGVDCETVVQRAGAYDEELPLKIAALREEQREQNDLLSVAFDFSLSNEAMRREMGRRQKRVEAIDSEIKNLTLQSSKNWERAEKVCK